MSRNSDALAPKTADWTEALRRIEQARRSNAQQLDLCGLNLAKVPDSLTDLTHLRSTFVWEDTNLRSLDLSRNQLTNIPDFLGQLTKLRLLNLSRNQLTVIAESLGQLKKLATLDFSHNRISRVPDFLIQLRDLQQLYFANNQITELPESLADLTELKSLDLSGNGLTNIPDSLARLTQLTHLFLHGNPGLGIPDEILGPTRDQVLGSSALSPRPPKELLSYYFSQRTNFRPLNEAKLILVGQGFVGKTSLVKALTTGEFDSAERTTEGIKISDWRLPVGEETITLHIWDFGGQEMMHATHQFFLTARSLYLLVLNRRPGGSDREADYWFRLIRAFGGRTAPVIVVLNKQRSEPFDVNRGGWLEKYAENIRGFVTTDCTTEATMAHLRQKIKEHLGDLKDLKAGFPAHWFAIKDELAHMRTQYVTYQEYSTICRKHGEADPEQQSSLGGFLHDLGIALNYRYDPRLRFAYVLKPEWVTEGIYGLLHAFVTTKGLFTRDEAAQTLSKKGYLPEAADFIMGLMEQFELSFPLGDPQRRSLIPQLLDDQQPSLAGDFNLEKCLNFGYQYPIITDGLLPRFIARTHHLSEPMTRWKSGVILRDRTSGCRALIRGDSGEAQVRIHIDGEEGSRRELLAVIRHNFDAIHADYQFQPDELVYLSGVPDKPILLDDLKAFQQNGLETMAIKLPDRTVVKTSIASLVEPVGSSPPPVRLFLSYAHKDEEYAKELIKSLKLMERNGLISTWYDRALNAGDKWEERILQELNLADVVVCQLSRDFLASDFCVLKELDRAIDRKLAGEAEMIAYVLKDCGWKEEAKLRQFQVLPKDGKPLPKWRGKDEYWQAVADGIKAAVKNVQTSRASRRP